ncbi:sarcosine oxidase subunit delta [Xinfangfangia sp. D13-10-4-6]|uniref:sarcosine oxidase subunit delta n=1 Tax=Pseudogemmobacter hezensis TaxID=2737662 RepID=UPI0015523EAA|nr:sarcosine oxidase subunit delta [Pseudogemmobacter hezensis]NPD13965.1 sarcosine oxidase subunit delta [Pseudogemmobacter hezensis]
MRLTCPLCGPRDRREFTYLGAEDYLHRPAPDAPRDAPPDALSEAWDSYLHLRDNPAGPTRDLWYHEQGCAAWLLVSRNTITHEITGVELVANRKGGAA